ncbi:MAG: UvrB/UvrC motif-containing protein [Elusimicrobiota bacterium]
MLCSRCGKKEASIVFTQLADNTVRELRVCGDCAREIETGPSSPSGAPLAALLSSFGPLRSPGERRRLKCESCGLSYAELKKSGFLGCAACYRSFAGPLEEILQEIHGCTSHGGKSPPLAPEEALARLKTALGQAIKSEDFEKAAQLRDRLKALEKECS